MVSKSQAALAFADEVAELATLLFALEELTATLEATLDFALEVATEETTDDATELEERTLDATELLEDAGGVVPQPIG